MVLSTLLNFISAQFAFTATSQDPENDDFNYKIANQIKYPSPHFNTKSKTSQPLNQAPELSKKTATQHASDNINLKMEKDLHPLDKFLNEEFFWFPTNSQRKHNCDVLNEIRELYSVIFDEIIEKEQQDGLSEVLAFLDSRPSESAARKIDELKNTLQFLMSRKIFYFPLMKAIEKLMDNRKKGIRIITQPPKVCNRPSGFFEFNAPVEVGDVSRTRKFEQQSTSHCSEIDRPVLNISRSSKKLSKKLKKKHRVHFHKSIAETKDNIIDKSVNHVVPTEISALEKQIEKLYKQVDALKDMYRSLDNTMVPSESTNRAPKRKLVHVDDEDESAKKRWSNKERWFGMGCFN